MRISFSSVAVLIFSTIILTGCFNKKAEIQVETPVSTGSTVTGMDQQDVPVLPTEGDSPTKVEEPSVPQQEAKDPLEDFGDSDFDHKSLKDPEMDGLMNYIDSLLAE